MPSKIMKELLDATGVKKKSSQSQQDFNAAFADAVGALEDDAWSRLSKPAQDYGNTVVKLLNKTPTADLPAPPDADDGDGAAPPKAKTTAAPAKKVETKKTETKPAAAPAKKVNDKPVVNALTSGGGATMLIKKALLAQPDISIEDLAAKLTSQGVKASNLTISTIRSDFRHTLKVLKAEGKLRGVQI